MKTRITFLIQLFLISLSLFSLSSFQLSGVKSKGKKTDQFYNNRKKQLLKIENDSIRINALCGYYVKSIYDFPDQRKKIIKTIDSLNQYNLMTDLNYFLIHRLKVFAATNYLREHSNKEILLEHQLLKNRAQQYNRPVYKVTEWFSSYLHNFLKGRIDSAFIYLKYAVNTGHGKKNFHGINAFIYKDYAMVTDDVPIISRSYMDKALSLTEYLPKTVRRIETTWIHVDLMNSYIKTKEYDKIDSLINVVRTTYKPLKKNSFFEFQKLFMELKVLYAYKRIDLWDKKHDSLITYYGTLNNFSNILFLKASRFNSLVKLKKYEKAKLLFEENSLDLPANMTDQNKYFYYKSLGANDSANFYLDQYIFNTSLNQINKNNFQYLVLKDQVNLESFLRNSNLEMSDYDNFLQKEDTISSWLKTKAIVFLILLTVCFVMIYFIQRRSIRSQLVGSEHRQAATKVLNQVAVRVCREIEQLYKEKTRQYLIINEFLNESIFETKYYYSSDPDIPGFLFKYMHADEISLGPEIPAEELRKSQSILEYQNIPSGKVRYIVNWHASISVPIVENFNYHLLLKENIFEKIELLFLIEQLNRRVLEENDNALSITKISYVFNLILNPISTNFPQKVNLSSIIYSGLTPQLYLGSKTPKLKLNFDRNIAFISNKKMLLSIFRLIFLYATALNRRDLDSDIRISAKLNNGLLVMKIDSNVLPLNIIEKIKSDYFYKFFFQGKTIEGTSIEIFSEMLDKIGATAEVKERISVKYLEITLPVELIDRNTEKPKESSIREKLLKI